MSFNRLVAASLFFSLAATSLSALPPWTVSSPVEVTATPLASPPGDPYFVVDVTVDPQSGDIGVFFSAAVNGTRELRVRFFDDQGVPLGGEMTLLADPQLSDFKVVRDPTGNFLVAWAGPLMAGLPLQARCFDAAGQSTGGPWSFPGSRLGSLEAGAGGSYLAFPTGQGDASIQRLDCALGPQGSPVVVSQGGFPPYLHYFGANGRQLFGGYNSVPVGPGPWRGVKDLLFFDLHLLPESAASFVFLKSFFARDGIELVKAQFGMVPHSSELGRLISDRQGQPHELESWTITKEGLVGPAVSLPVAPWGACQLERLEVIPLGRETAIVHFCDGDLAEARMLSEYGAPYSPRFIVHNPPTFQGTFGAAAAMPNGDLAVASTRLPEAGFGTVYLHFVRRDPGLLFYDGFETGTVVAWK